MSLQDVFDELIDLPPDERMARLRALSLSEPERQRLQAMLDDATMRLALLDVPISAVIGNLKSNDFVFSRLVGGTVGPFQILELIGEGGSAAVFRASRPAGSGEQLVALKVLRASVLSSDGERRFRREQAILAQLTHPNVARLIEGGVDNSSHAYIAMELVDGEPITRAAAARALGIDERLEWFLTLCRAIDAAHLALVVHCDLKPSNILVDRDGVLKVLDFGIARLIDASREDQPTRTIALTPEYAAPEQFHLGPPRISVDVYALGVILGELLTGQRLGASFGKPPSVAVQDADAPPAPAGLPRAEVLARKLSGDLDAIVTMATEHDAASRYRSVAALAEDVQRFLSGRPVLARTPNRRYRLRKFIGRHRAALATSLTVVLALIVGLGIASWQAVVAQRAAREAQAQAARADSMRNMVFDVLSEAEPGKPRPAEATVTEAAEHAIASLLADHTADPRTRLELLARFADTLGRQGRPDRAQEILQRASIDARELVGANDVLALMIEERLASFEIQRGSYAAARTRLDRLLATVPPAVSELRVRTLRSSASVAWHMHDRERALSDGNMAVALSRQLGDAEVERDTLTYFGAALLGADAVPEAIEVYKRLLEANIAKYGPSHEQVALAYSGLSRAYRRHGELDKAEASVRRALAIDAEVYRGDHWIKANHLNALTMVLIQKSDYPSALEASRESVRIAVGTLDDSHIDRLSHKYQLGYVLMMMERYDEAVPLLREVLERRVERFGAAQPETLMVRGSYAYALGMSGDPTAGDAELERTIADLTNAATPDFDLLAKTIDKRIRLALARGDAVKASQLLATFADVIAKVSTPLDRAWIGKAETLRGAVLLLQNRAREGSEALRRAGAELESGASSDALEPVEQRLLLASSYAALKDGRASSEAIEARRLLAALPYAPPRLSKVADALPR